VLTVNNYFTKKFIKQKKKNYLIVKGMTLLCESFFFFLFLFLFLLTAF